MGFWIAVAVGLAVAWLFPTWVAVLSRSGDWGLVFVVNLASVIVWLAWPAALGMAIAEANEQSRTARMPKPVHRRLQRPDEDWREYLFGESYSSRVAPTARVRPRRWWSHGPGRGR